MTSNTHRRAPRIPRLPMHELRRRLRMRMLGDDIAALRQLMLIGPERFAEYERQMYQKEAEWELLKLRPVPLLKGVSG